MAKFIIKFFTVFFSFVAFLFFALIAFNTSQMDKMAPESEMFAQAAPPPPPIFIPILFIAILSFIFIFIVFRYIAKNFIQPLLNIESNVKKIKDGHFDVKFETKSENKEICDTFLILNEMTQGLKQRERLYDNFIQNIVHDLRAPIIAQERAMEILSEEFEDNSLVQGLVSNNDAFLKMVNDIIEAFSERDMKIEKTHFNLSKMVNSIITAFTPLCESKNIKINNYVEDNMEIFADYLSFNRIIANLTSNAIENIDKGKSITIKADKNAEKTHIIVEDNGKGIKDVNEIFKKYSSSNKTNKKRVSGLGLAITAELVQKNNGTITVESELNNFTKFIIELPNE